MTVRNEIEKPRADAWMACAMDAGHVPGIGPFMLLSVLLLFSGCAEEPGIQNHLERARDLQEQGQHRAAIIELKNVLVADPGHNEARWLLARIYIKVKDGVSAEKELGRMAGLGLPRKDTLVPMARALLLQEENQRLLNEIVVEDALPANTRAELLSLRGEAMLRLGRGDDARLSFDQALELLPTHLDARLGVIRVAIGEGDYRQADNDLQALSQTESQSAVVTALIGDLSQRKGDSEAAAKAFSRAVEQDPDHFPAHLGLIRSQLSQGKIEPAQARLRRLSKSFPHHPELLYLHAWALFQQQEYGMARDQLLAVLKTRPDHWDAVQMMALAHFTLGQLNQADEYVRRFLLIHPDHEPMRLLHDRILERLQTRDEGPALAELGKPVADKDAGLLQLAGRSALHAGVEVGRQASGAVRDQVEADTRAGDDSRTARDQAALIGEARREIEQGQVDQAIVGFRRAMLSGPDHLGPGFQLFRLYLGRGDMEDALEVGQYLSGVAAESPIPHNLIGSVHLHRKEFAQARSALDRALQIDPGHRAAQLNLAVLERQTDRLVEARHRLRDLLLKHPEELRALVELAELEIQDGNGWQAMEMLEQARRINPLLLKPYRLLMHLYMAEGHREKALQLARKASDLVPDNPEVNKAPDAGEFRYHLAWVLSRLGDDAGALRQLEELQLDTVKPELRGEVTALLQRLQSGP